jgi:ferredoxin/flavodoxin---NADP+ reductase
VIKYSEGHVVNSKRWTERLHSLQVEAPVEPFKAGQFGKLALEINGEMVFRPYSYVNAPQERPLEFYFITLPEGPLTPRLVELELGDLIYVARRAAGFLTLSELPDADNLWLLSTGTAIGPFLSILKTEEPWHRFSSIVLVHAVRQAEELTYQDQIRQLLDGHPQHLKVISFVSREDTDFAIKGRVPEAIKDGRLVAKAGVQLSAEKSQVMICGNPDMVRDTSLVLEEQGFKKNRRKAPGHISVENYW